MSLFVSDDANFRFCAEDVEATRALGEALARSCVGGLLIGLSGPLGAGKTEFARGVACGLGISEAVSSPTFVLESVYEISAKDGGIEALHHWDLYRLAEGVEPAELLDLRSDPCSLTLIEWPERSPLIQDLLDLAILIDFPTLSPDLSEQSSPREISISFRGRGLECAKELEGMLEACGVRSLKRHKKENE